MSVELGVIGNELQVCQEDPADPVLELIPYHGTHAELNVDQVVELCDLLIAWVAAQFPSRATTPRRRQPR